MNIETVQTQRHKVITEKVLPSNVGSILSEVVAREYEENRLRLVGFSTAAIVDHNDPRPMILVTMFFDSILG